ncbi:hypothetical protein SAMN04487948_1437 [Halogranum amylolyticum]|uniref:Uncharacterized protein n=1 Tax=Halogranum amylolyticum TaxID=660520 RepID=A0A1H8WU06_9EURY|nr:hypothetical protein [Halogranum amylolyticum]SEP31111.1 hypothetical protein SAMN04487948_1437 [Halogranum amylolyticum]
MPTQTPAERVRSRASWLAANAAIATVLALGVSLPYFYVTDDVRGVLLSLPVAALALSSLGVSLVAGVAANARQRAQREAKPISNVSKSPRERGR